MIWIYPFKRRLTTQYLSRIAIDDFPSRTAALDFQPNIRFGRRPGNKGCSKERNYLIFLMRGT